MITLTEKAVNKLRQFSEDEGIGHLCVRVKVVGGGCAGMSHDMAFDDAIGDMDEKIEQDGIILIIDCVSYSYLEELEIDYIDSQFGEGFKFNMPSEYKTCGCGSSIGL